MNNKNIITIFGKAFKTKLKKGIFIYRKLHQMKARGDRGITSEELRKISRTYMNTVYYHSNMKDISLASKYIWKLKMKRNTSLTQSYTETSE